MIVVDQSPKVLKRVNFWCVLGACFAHFGAFQLWMVTGTPQKCKPLFISDLITIQHFGRCALFQLALQFCSGIEQLWAVSSPVPLCTIVWASESHTPFSWLQLFDSLHLRATITVVEVLHFKALGSAGALHENWIPSAQSFCALHRAPTCTIRFVSLW